MKTIIVCDAIHNIGFEILGKERVKNIIEPIDEIQIEGKLKPDNIIDSNIEIEILGREDYNISEHISWALW